MSEKFVEAILAETKKLPEEHPGLLPKDIADAENVMALIPPSIATARQLGKNFCWVATFYDNDCSSSWLGDKANFRFAFPHWKTRLWARFRPQVPNQSWLRGAARRLYERCQEEGLHCELAPVYFEFFTRLYSSVKVPAIDMIIHWAPSHLEAALSKARSKSRSKQD
jgi:hypothetical protein